MQADTLIIGGGLSGLHTAYELSKRNADFLLVDARDRLGGRILSRQVSGLSDEGAGSWFDLGPAWFWPGQAQMENLVAELGLADDVFMQYADGVGVYETDTDVARGGAGFSMRGSLRLRGGMQGIARQLQSEIASDRVRLNAPVAKLRLDGGEVVARVESNGVSNGESIDVRSKHVVVALPPRVALQTLSFEPMLPPERRDELRAVQTWMAGHAKVVVLYTQPFWRYLGLSGDALSQRGPLAEIHDASAEPAGPFALFGFVAGSLAQRATDADALREAVIEQLSRLFGSDAEKAVDVLVKDWALDAWTATPLDRSMPRQHDYCGMVRFAEPGWDNRLIWSGSETASGHVGGYLEGALAASARTLGTLGHH